MAKSKRDEPALGEVAKHFGIDAAVVTVIGVIHFALEVDACNEIEAGQIAQPQLVFPALKLARRTKGADAFGEVIAIGFG